MGISAEQWLLVVNSIQNKGFCLYNISVYIYYVYMKIHTYSIYFENTYMYLQVFIFLLYNLYDIEIYLIYKQHIFIKYIHAWVCTHIHNNYTQYTQYIIYTKTFILDAINRCSALMDIYA